MGGIHLQKKELVWFGCFYIFLLPQTMLPSNDQIANQSCSSGQQQMATLFGVVEKYTRNQFQLSESVPFWVWNHSENHSQQSLGRSPKNWSRSKIKIKWNDLQDQDQRSFLKWSCQIKIICMILADQDQDHGLSIYCDLDLFSERSPLLDQWKWSFRSRSFLQINKSDLCTQRSKIISKDLIFCTKDQWSSRTL